MEWIIVHKDTMPEHGQKCQVWDEYHKTVELCIFNSRYACWDDGDGDDYYTDAIGGKITHWAPTLSKPNIANKIK